ncbi:UNVERIFIED_CONTAM: hypothetical protein FKN15_055552 [Acipenser sinensis]
MTTYFLDLPRLCSDLMPLVSLFLFQEPVIMFPAVASVVVCIALALSGAAGRLFK